MTEKFIIDGVEIKAPDDNGYKPVFATTSTEDSDRTQDLIMHNTPMGTIAGYDLSWSNLTSLEISTILNAVMNKPYFIFHHRSPLKATGWDDAYFYASNFNVEAGRLKDGQDLWKKLSFNVRSIYPV